MNPKAQQAKADFLRKLHSGPEILVLPNAWDAISARIVEAEGFPAIATSSAGVAGVLGYPDGQQIPRTEMLFIIGKIAQAVNAPVTADVEAGYDDPAQTALDLIEAGAVGLNFEDMIGHELVPLAQQLAKSGRCLPRATNPAFRWSSMPERISSSRSTATKRRALTAPLNG